jgi:NADH dehydrogenase
MEFLQKKNIVIIGGGYGGIAAARELERIFRRDNGVQITLIDKRPFHTLMTELHEVAGFRVEPDSVRVPYSKVFGASKINVRTDTIKSVDFERRLAVSAERVYPYDYLVVASGAEPEFFGINGIRENAFTLWSYDDAMKLRHHIERTFEEAVAETNSQKRNRMLTFVVAGAGFTGIELAGELLEWRDVMCARWLTPKSDARIVIVEAAPNILPILEEDLRANVESYLKKKGVELLTDSPIVGADAGIVRLKSGSTLETDTFVWTAGVSGGSFAESLDLSKGPFGRNTGDGNAKNRKGRLLVTEELRSVDHPEVFAAGDNIWHTENGKPLPQIVETAIQTGKTAAYNIAADIEGMPAKKFKPDYHGFMVSVGGKYAVSNAMGIKLSGFFAVMVKHLVNLHYLIGIGGINQCWEYIKHEFLDMADGRSCLRGFGAYKTRGYWLLPMRLWLGISWLFESINKIGEGWLSWSAGSKSSWMFSPGVVQAGVKTADAAADAVTDAVSAASESVAGTAATAVTDAVSAASESAAGTVADAGQAIWDMTKPIFDVNGAVAVWFRTTFMDGAAAHIPFQFFQLIIVMTEMLIGLSLLGGLLTWPAAALSIVMCFVFTLSGMFAWNQAWFVFAAILMLGGGGRAFGLDCWVIPFFKKWWNGTRIARRHHLYLDLPSK